MSKYSIWYYDLCESRKYRDRCDNSEIHHITPTCCGGENTDDNLVCLTYREHFIAHYLLYKMSIHDKYGDTSKLACAFHFMKERGKNSRFFSNFEKEFKTILSKRWKNIGVILRIEKLNLEGLRHNGKMTNILNSWKQLDPNIGKMNLVEEPNRAELYNNSPILKMLKNIQKLYPGHGKIQTNDELCCYLNHILKYTQSMIQNRILLQDVYIRNC